MGCRLVLHTISGVLLTGALVLCSTALFTTRWQTLTTRSLPNRTLGLYEGCIERTGVENARGGWVCSYYKFEEDDRIALDVGVQRTIFNGDVETFRVATLILLAAGVLVGLVALIMCAAACAGRSVRCLTISWAVGSIITALLVIAAVAVFAKNAHEQANRFTTSPAGHQLEIFVGWSFHIAIAGAVALVVSTVLAVVTVVVVFTAEETVVQHKYQYQQVTRNSAV